MKLDSGCLSTAKLCGITDMMYMAILYSREYAAHTSDYTRLLAVMYMTSSDDMASDTLFGPAMILAAAYGVSLHLRRALDTSGGEVHIIFGIKVFTERYTAATAVMNFTVFYYPAFGPVRTDHSVLICCRRRPCGCAVLDLESAYRNITYAILIRHEAVSSDHNLN